MLLHRIHPSLFMSALKWVYFYCSEGLRSGGRGRALFNKSSLCTICEMQKMRDGSDARLSLSQAATTSARCICLPVTVLHDYLSQLAPEGTPALKEATLPSTTASVRESERGRPQSHQNSLVGTDAINRNLHRSRSERPTLCPRSCNRGRL